MKLHLLLLLVIFRICYSCAAQTNTVAEMDKRILYIFQDKSNNMWFGSNGQGVYRYDGKTIMHFTTKDGLCHDQIRGIQADRKGAIYFTTDVGVSKFDGKSFTTLHSTRSNLPNNGWRLHADDLWFRGAQDSGVVYRYDGALLHRLEFPRTKAGEDFIAKYPRSAYPQMTFSPYDVYSIYKERKGNLWFGTNMGVCRYDGNTFAWLSEQELGIDDISFHVRSTYEDKDGRFWFTNTMHRHLVYPDNGTKTGSINFKKEKGIVNSKDHDAAYFLSSTEDNNGDLWMVTYNKGVWRYDGKQLTQYLVKNGADIVTLFTIYKDRQGDLWLGSHTSGVYKFNGKRFEPFKPSL